MVMSLRRKPGQKGYEVEMAIDGPAALEAAKTCNRDVVLMDLSLPIMDGWEVTRRLRDDPANIHRLKGSEDSTHYLEADESRPLQKASE